MPHFANPLCFHKPHLVFLCQIIWELATLDDPFPRCVFLRILWFLPQNYGHDTDVKSAADDVLPIKGDLTWGRFTINIYAKVFHIRMSFQNIMTVKS